MRSAGLSGGENAQTLSYEEAAELAYFGAKVLHPKTIQPAVDLEIPVRVCNSREPSEQGTMVLPAAKSTPRKIKSIAHKTGITVLHITSPGCSARYGFMSAIFQIFERHRTVVDVVTTSEVSVSLTLDNTAALDAVVADLTRIGSVDIERDQAIICLVGSGLRNTAGVAAQIFSAIADFNVLDDLARRIGREYDLCCGSRRCQRCDHKAPSDVLYGGKSMKLIVAVVGLIICGLRCSRAFVFRGGISGRVR